MRVFGDILKAKKHVRALQVVSKGFSSVFGCDLSSWVISQQSFQPEFIGLAIEAHASRAWAC